MARKRNGVAFTLAQLEKEIKKLHAVRDHYANILHDPFERVAKRYRRIDLFGRFSIQNGMTEATFLQLVHSADEDEVWIFDEAVFEEDGWQVDGTGW